MRIWSRRYRLHTTWATRRSGMPAKTALDQCLRSAGGFNHNAQALRIVEELEVRYAGFAGLNLSFEVLEGQQHRAEKRTGTSAARPLLEVQAVDAADSVAYDSHDPDDALEVGLLSFGELMEIRMWRESVQRVRRRYTGLDERELRRATVHELIDWQVSDLLQASAARLASCKPTSADEVRRCATIVLPGTELADLKNELEQFLNARVYRHANLLASRRQVQEQLRRLFERYVAEPELLPKAFLDRALVHGIQRTVSDYLAGMTDRFAEQEYERLIATV